VDQWKQHNFTGQETDKTTLQNVGCSMGHLCQWIHPKEEWRQLAQAFYAHYYADSKRDVMKAYQSTLAMNISDNATRFLQLFEKNKDNEIVPVQLRMAELSTKKLSKKCKEVKVSGMDNRMMSVHAKLPTE
jgi:hypothetical protein